MNEKTSNYNFVGWLAIGLGVLFNPWVVGWLFGSEGGIESITFLVGIIAIMALLIGFGLLCLRASHLRLTGVLVNLFMAGLMTLLMIFGFDYALRFVGSTAETLPQVAHPPNANYPVNNLEFDYTFTTNSQGIRYAEIPLEKPNDTVRVVVVGDSYTEGAGVELEETFLLQSEALLSTPERKVELINCGLSGTPTLNHALILFHVCMQYDPDAVLLAFHTNDITESAPGTTSAAIDFGREKRVGVPGVLYALWPRLTVLGEKAVSGWQNRAVDVAPTESSEEDEVLDLFIREDNQMMSAAASVPKEESDLVKQVTAEAQRRGYISKEEIAAWVESLPNDLVVASDQRLFNGYIMASGLLNPTYWSDSLNIDTADAEAKYLSVVTVLTEMRDRLARAEVPFGIVFLPSPIQFDERYGGVWAQTGSTVDPAWTESPTELERRMAELTDELGVPYLDLSSNYRALIQADRETVWSYPLDGHLTAEGHRVAAEWVSEWLKGWVVE